MIKRILLIMLLLIFAGLFTSVLAQESELYYRSIPIVRVYPHRLGYRILYSRSNMELADFFVPISWFQYDPDGGGVGRGELVMANDRSFPYFSIFWRNGEFSHIRLYLHRDRRHESWGNIPVNANWDDRFNADTLNLLF